MIRDILTLRARLRVASVSLLAAAGCASPGTSEVVPASGSKAVEPVAVDKPVTTPQPPPDPPPPNPPSTPIAEPRIAQYPRATCPSGTWSGTLEEAQKRTSDLTKSLDCPAAIHGIVDPERKSPEVPPGARAHLDEAATKALGAGHCSYTWTIPCPGGRPLLADDGPRVAEAIFSAAWLAELAPADSLPEQLREVIAGEWLQDARSEHASVASFARATLELLALAAPPALVAASQRASLEEIEHARLCFALASRYAGAALGPGPLPAVPTRPAELVRLACDTFVEGCVGETIAALVATRAARRCADPSVTAVLARIADDEAEHAALAWATVAWAVSQGGEAVRSAVRALARDLHAAALRAAPPAPAPSAALLAHHGRLDAAAHHACLVDAWQHLIADAVAELCGDSHPASDDAQA